MLGRLVGISSSKDTARFCGVTKVGIVVVVGGRAGAALDGGSGELLTEMLVVLSSGIDRNGLDLVLSAWGGAVVGSVTEDTVSICQLAIGVVVLITFALSDLAFSVLMIASAGSSSSSSSSSLNMEKLQL